MDPEEAKSAISFRTFNKSVTDKFVALSHARDMLQAIIMGEKIEILPTDDLSAFIKVFTEYVQSPPFYDLPPEIQDYLSQKIKDIALFGAPEEEWQAATDMKTVSPHQSPKQTAPQMQAAAQPAGPQDPLADIPFPTEGQNLPGLPSPVSSVQGGG